MKLPQEVIIRPVITERSTMDAAMGKYTFAVASTATKTEVRQAVEKLFSVKVLKVNTANIDGKKKRMGVHQGYTSAWKKAVVTIDTNPQPQSFQVEGGKASQSTRKFKTEIEEFGFGQ
ncbi:MAG: 50S ribosomal protein L23 [Clostridia bacterium]|nr:50S ribosomal protein L23 [Eubacteriales bacterium]MDD3866122.1 50S ribosomal protein L23 [Eubacteriales bacterium]MDD4461127.1 50S ribosomal protein L23 [Eubacteriales bacterium]NCC84396.1 50S ribosomal protein L23 [Clostridia bacterium]